MKAPILVTGSHRSGTGWVGQILSASPEPVGYIWEPFSILHRPGICAAHFEHWFPYVCPENDLEILGPFIDTLQWHYAAGAEIKAVRSAKDVARMARDMVRYERNRRRQALPLLKDPIAVFSVEWLHSSFGVQPVLLVRHPAAFAASVKRLNLRHPFEHFLAQPLLMRDWLEPFRAQIEVFADREQDIVDQAILLWNVIHHALVTYHKEYPDWPFVRLEDLSRNPSGTFTVLFSWLNLPYSGDVQRVIEETSSPANPAEATRMDSIKRDSAAHIWNWKKTLSSEEIHRVRQGTDAISGQLYGSKDWEK